MLNSFGNNNFLSDDDVEAVYADFVKEFGFYKKGHVEPKFPRNFVDELRTVFPYEMGHYYDGNTGSVCKEAWFLAGIGLFNYGYGGSLVTSIPLEELKLKNRKALFALCGAYNRFKKKQKEAKQTQGTNDDRLKEFYENFASLFCGRMSPEKGWDANHAMLLKEMYDCLNEFYSKEMKTIEEGRYNQELGNAHMRPIRNTWAVLTKFGLAESDVFGTAPKRFEELGERAKEVLLRFKETFERYNISMKKIPVASSKGNKYRYFLERNIGDGSKVSYDPRSASIMVVDKNENGRCYYGDGYVNPVRDGQTFPNEGKLLDKKIFRKVRECFGFGDFNEVKQYLPKLVVMNGLDATPSQQKIVGTHKVNVKNISIDINGYVQMPLNNRGSYVSFNPQNPTSIMVYNKKTGTGHCFYPDGYMNPVRNMRTFREEGIYYGNKGRAYFHELLRQMQMMYRAYKNSSLSVEYGASSKNIKTNQTMGLNYNYGLSSGSGVLQ